MMGNALAYCVTADVHVQLPADSLPPLPVLDAQ
jgi:hypothetical protein